MQIGLFKKCNGANCVFVCLVAKPLPCQWEAGVFLGEELEGRSPSFRFFSLSEGSIFGAGLGARRVAFEGTTGMKKSLSIKLLELNLGHNTNEAIMKNYSFLIRERVIQKW